MPKEFEASPMSRPDETFIRRAIEQADVNVLRLALYQQTRDPNLAKMRVERTLRFGVFSAYTLAPEYEDEVREKALAYLLCGEINPVEAPSRDETAELMAIFLDRKLLPEELDFGHEELSFDANPRDVEWGAKPSPDKLNSFQVVIVGAGISGMAAAIQLGRLGIPYRIIDKQKGLGGTWFLNDYPEARVDISTHIYQYKFEKNYPWKSQYATQGELKEYLQHIADKYDVRKHISLETEVTEAKWDPSSKRWKLRIENSDGSKEMLSANVVISCSGLFTTPKLPDIEGIEQFKGKTVHTTSWDHDFKLDDKSVAVIGTGCTGCQMVPGLAPQADSLTVFQRTPSWITPVPNYQSTTSKELRWLFDTLPCFWNWSVFSTYVADAQFQELQEIDQEWVKDGGTVSERSESLRELLTMYIQSKFVGQSELAEKCTPSYPPFARRIVIDNGWYDALNRDNVELVTDGIECITEQGIQTKDGVNREFDLIVFSSGFSVSKYLWPANYEGREGVTPEKLWDKDGARAHLGMTMPGFPNFFTFYGPNGQSRGGGFHSWAEIWSRYVGSLIVQMIESDTQELEVKQEIFDDYNQRMDDAMKGMIWESEGNGGYYVNEQGRSGVNMPWSVHEFYEMVREPKFDDFNWT